jgi:HEAT repeat protein
MQMLGCDDSFVRSLCIDVLGDLQCTEVLEEIERIAKNTDESAYVRASCIRAMGKMGSDRTAKSLAPLLQSREKKIVDYTCEALANIACPASLNFLISHFQNTQDTFERLWAIFYIYKASQRLNKIVAAKSLGLKHITVLEVVLKQIAT